MTETLTAANETVRAVINDQRADVQLLRPNSLNAMNMEMMYDVVEIFDLLESKNDVRIATLSGLGRAFCVGADQRERGSMSDQDIRSRRRFAPRVFSSLRNYNRPVISVVHGHAYGGGLELALSADIVVVEQNSKMGLVETSRGTIPGGGGFRLLQQAIGPSKAAELIYTSARFTGEEAYNMGLVGHSTSEADLWDSVDELTSRIVVNSPIAVAQAKKVLRLTEDANYSDSLAIEAEHYERILASTDRVEALRAFQEKRAPCFTGE